MPTRLCLEARCPNPSTYRGRCAEHSRQTNHHTHHNTRIYNSRRWKALRERVLHDHPLCACDCGHIATDVDHITPIQQGGDIWNPANLQPLTTACHSRKTKQEQQQMSYINGR